MMMSFPGDMFTYEKSCRRGRAHLPSVECRYWILNSDFRHFTVAAFAVRMEFVFNLNEILVCDRSMININASPGSTSTTFHSFWLIIYILYDEKCISEKERNLPFGKCRDAQQAIFSDRNLMDPLPFLWVVVRGWAHFIDARPFSWSRCKLRTKWMPNRWDLTI